MSIQLPCSLNRESFFGPSVLRDPNFPKIKMGEVKDYHWITAFFLSFFVDIVEVKDCDRQIRYLNKASVVEFLNKNRSFLKPHKRNPLIEQGFPSVTTRMIKYEKRLSELRRNYREFLSQYQPKEESLQRCLTSSGLNFSYFLSDSKDPVLFGQHRPDSTFWWLYLECSFVYCCGAVLKVSGTKVDNFKDLTELSSLVMNSIPKNLFDLELRAILKKLNRMERVQYAILEKFYLNKKFGENLLTDYQEAANEQKKIEGLDPQLVGGNLLYGSRNEEQEQRILQNEIIALYLENHPISNDFISNLKEAAKTSLISREKMESFFNLPNLIGIIKGSKKICFVPEEWKFLQELNNELLGEDIPTAFNRVLELYYYESSSKFINALLDSLISKVNSLNN